MCEKMGIDNFARVNLGSIDLQYAECVKLLSLRPNGRFCGWRFRKVSVSLHDISGGDCFI